MSGRLISNGVRTKFIQANSNLRPTSMVSYLDKQTPVLPESVSVKHMSYSERLSASENRAHSQLVATKIDREMKVLRGMAESSPSARRRWGWELLQNAKDVYTGSGVRVEINYDDVESILSFRHTGKPFSADNIRFLIEQISTKDRELDENGLRKETGRFGTGFLSTHLLSEVVQVSGVAKEPDLEHKQFSFSLDRSGDSLSEITSAVSEAKQSVQDIDSLPDYDLYDPDEFNTEFEFKLSDSLSHEVAKAGMKDLRCCLPFTLVFVSELDSVELTCADEQFKISYDGEVDNTDVRLTQFNGLSSDNGGETVSIATVTKGLTSVSILVEVLDDDEYSLQSIARNTPRLFCDFPLVGSEVFPFPAIINNPHFDPTDPRDGVYLKDSKRGNKVALNNQTIMSEAVECYRVLVDCAIEGEWGNLHLLADVRPLRRSVEWVSRAWFDENVAAPIRKIIAHQNIVTTANNSELSPILDDWDEPEIWFPKAASREVRDQIWELAAEWFPKSVPHKDHVELWNPLVWDECGQLTTEEFCKRVEEVESTSELASQLEDDDWVAWLNSFYEMLQADESNTDALVHNKSIFPNQHGEFCQLDSLHFDVGDIEDELKEILNLLGVDIRKRLADREIAFSIPGDRQIDRANVVGQIRSLVQEKCNDREVARSFREAFDALLKWFRANPTIAAESFPSLYRKKHLLYDEESVVENMDKAEQLDQLLKDSGVEDVVALRALISTDKRNPRLPLSEEILASLGITTIEEWEEALKDKDLAAMFSHESTPSTAMFLYVQGLIERAKESVLEHLESLDCYDVAEVEETAPTVLGGILKHGREIQLVIRPAYSGEVIIYYPAERSVLDFIDDAELWADTGDRQFQVTLGHILKTTEIQKFPV